MSVIRRYARQVAERFQPDKIILFGSFAYWFLREIVSQGKVLYEKSGTRLANHWA